MCGIHLQEPAVAKAMADKRNTPPYLTHPSHSVVMPSLEALVAQSTPKTLEQFRRNNKAAKLAAIRTAGILPAWNNATN